MRLCGKKCGIAKCENFIFIQFLPTSHNYSLYILRKGRKEIIKLKKKYEKNHKAAKSSQ
jgi:hypothetical protein